MTCTYCTEGAIEKNTEIPQINPSLILHTTSEMVGEGTSLIVSTSMVDIILSSVVSSNTFTLHPWTLGRATFRA